MYYEIRIQDEKLMEERIETLYDISDVILEMHNCETKGQLYTVLKYCEEE